jgi:hypothetical protein
MVAGRFGLFLVLVWVRFIAFHDIDNSRCCNCFVVGPPSGLLGRIRALETWQAASLRPILRDALAGSSG